MTAVAAATVRAELAAARIAVLEGFVSGNGPAGRSIDSGAAVLAALVAAADGQPDLARRAVHRWLAGFSGGFAGYGLFTDGMAGLLAGLDVAAGVEPKLAGLAATTRAQLASWSAGRPWRASQVDWIDYDLLWGPSGVLLALAAGGRPDDLAGIAGHLAALCQPGLAPLRIGVPHPGRPAAANFGRINTGLGHGVPGPLAALTTASRRLASPALHPALRALCEWLLEHQVRDGLGLAGWRGFEIEDGPVPKRIRPQAWCYGTPGVAWNLWQAGVELEEPAICAAAVKAFEGLCPHWQPQLYLHHLEPGSHLAICHGAAGVLAVADAFARHTGSIPAAELRDRLQDYLIERLDEVLELAVIDMTLLNGASGVLAVLTTVGGGNRHWLGQLSLR
jgi:lantibiotic biosynthesis protein